MKARLTVLFILLANVLANAQAAGVNSKATANQVWGEIQVYILFAIVIVTLIGGVTVYSKKDNPQEFSKYMKIFGTAFVFLIIVLSALQGIKTFATNSMNSITF